MGQKVHQDSTGYTLWQQSGSPIQYDSGTYLELIGLGHESKLMYLNSTKKQHERPKRRIYFCHAASGLGGICRVAFHLWLMRKLWAWHLDMDLFVVIHAFAGFPHTFSPFKWLKKAQCSWMNFSSCVPCSRHALHGVPVTVISYQLSSSSSGKHHNILNIRHLLSPCPRPCHL